MKSTEEYRDVASARLFLELSKECEKAEKYGDLSLNLLDAALRRIKIVDHHVYMNSRCNACYRNGCDFLLYALEKFSNKKCYIDNLSARIKNEIGILTNVRFLVFPPKSDYIEASEFCKAISLYFEKAVDNKTNRPYKCLKLKDTQ